MKMTRCVSTIVGKNMKNIEKTGKEKKIGREKKVEKSIVASKTVRNRICFFCLLNCSDGVDGVENHRLDWRSTTTIQSKRLSVWRRKRPIPPPPPRHNLSSNMKIKQTEDHDDDEQNFVVFFFLSLYCKATGELWLEAKTMSSYTTAHILHRPLSSSNIYIHRQRVVTHWLTIISVENRMQ